jgi:hypothetical protein
MPYFNGKGQNVLLIHIPKTGGTSINRYFCKKYNFSFDNKTFYGIMPKEEQIKNNISISTSLQHVTYQTILKYKDFFNINYENINIITAVRNPYSRIISDLFFYRKIMMNSSKEEVFVAIKDYLLETLDNHNIPQYIFISDDNKELIPNIKILHTETLQNDMIHLGYEDFNERLNCYINKVNYYDYLNTDSIQLINDFYDYDFKLFNYKKI